MHCNANTSTLDLPISCKSPQLPAAERHVRLPRGHSTPDRVILGNTDATGSRGLEKRAPARREMCTVHSHRHGVYTLHPAVQLAIQPVTIGLQLRQNHVL